MSRCEAAETSTTTTRKPTGEDTPRASKAPRATQSAAPEVMSAVPSASVAAMKSRSDHGTVASVFFSVVEP